MIAEEEVDNENKPDGELFRNHPVNIVTSTNKVIHEGITPHSKIVNHLQLLLNFLNIPSKITPIIKLLYHTITLDIFIHFMMEMDVLHAL